MDVVVSNVLADERLIPPETRYAIMRDNKDYRRALAHELWRIQGLLAVDFRLRMGDAGDPATTAANIDRSWIGTDVATTFARASHCDVTVVNDADAAGVAEMEFGAGKGRRGVVMMITLGTGIGTALFVDGLMVPNTELGHLMMGKQEAEARAADSVRQRLALSWGKWAKRLDAYPNFAVDTAARIRYFARGDRDQVRQFLTQYQDRVLYATDFSPREGDPSAASRSLQATHDRDWEFFSGGDMMEYAGRPTRGLALPDGLCVALVLLLAEGFAVEVLDQGGAVVLLDDVDDGPG